MEEKKSFFELLDPKSALIVGGVVGFLLLGTIGFVVLLVMNFSGRIGDDGAKTSVYNSPLASATQPAQQQPAQLPPPPTVPKQGRPNAELFVMSYCPYGLQMEKAFLPVMELLKKKADLNIKFVSYAMHGQKEVEENTRQYCIQSEQNSVYIPYLNCFDQSQGGTSESCRAAVGVNEAQLASCVTKTDKKFGITANFQDQTKWLNGRYPVYPIHQALNDQYGVQGSPTLILNGKEINIPRSPEAVKQAICAGFTNQPEECKTVLATASPVAGFGGATGAATGAADPSCGS